MTTLRSEIVTNACGQRLRAVVTLCEQSPHESKFSIVMLDPDEKEREKECLWPCADLEDECDALRVVVAYHSALRFLAGLMHDKYGVESVSDVLARMRNLQMPPPAPHSPAPRRRRSVMAERLRRAQEKRKSCLEDAS